MADLFQAHKRRENHGSDDKTSRKVFKRAERLMNGNERFPKARGRLFRALVIINKLSLFRNDFILFVDEAVIRAHRYKPGWRCSTSSSEALEQIELALSGRREISITPGAKRQESTPQGLPMRQEE